MLTRGVALGMLPRQRTRRVLADRRRAGEGPLMRNYTTFADLVKRVAEQKQRQKLASAALEAARNRVRARQRFVPKLFKLAEIVRVKL